MTRPCSATRAQRLIDEFEEASALDRGGFRVRHGIAAVLRHLADTEAGYADEESWYAIPASTLVQLAAALTAPTLMERAMAGDAAAASVPIRRPPMTDIPITPPTELFDQWEDDILNERDNVDHVLDCAWRNGFQSGADMELEACCEWLEKGPYGFSIAASASDLTGSLRSARRPKPLSLKDQALAQTDAILNDPSRVLLTEVRETLELNRRALEQFND